MSTQTDSDKVSAFLYPQASFVPAIPNQTISDSAGSVKSAPTWHGTALSVLKLESDVEDDEYHDGSFEYDENNSKAKRRQMEAQLPPRARAKLAKLKPSLSTEQKDSTDDTSEANQSHLQRYRNGGYAWDTEQEELLVKLREAGMSWSDIWKSQQFGPRTENALKARYNVIKSRNGDAEASSDDELRYPWYRGSRKRSHSSIDTPAPKSEHSSSEGTTPATSVSSDGPGARWTAEEKEALRQMRDEQNMSFEEIVACGRFGQRTLSAIRSYYCNVIRGRISADKKEHPELKEPARKKPRMNSVSAWTPEERRLLIQMREKQGMTFPQLERSGKFGNRDARAINGYYLLVKRGEITCDDDDDDASSSDNESNASAAAGKSSDSWSKDMKQTLIELRRKGVSYEDIFESGVFGDRSLRALHTAHCRAKAERKENHTQDNPTSRQVSHEDTDVDSICKKKLYSIYEDCKDEIMEIIEDKLNDSLLSGVIRIPRRHRLEALLAEVINMHAKQNQP